MRAFDIIEAEQRSDAWRLARCGRLTGSAAGDMLATIKTGEAAARRDLRIRLVTERLTLQPQESGFVSAEMQRGVDMEPIARGAYEEATSQAVRATGFLAHRTLAMGCSLDGHVGDFAGIVEIKVPKSATHLRYLREGKVPADHLAQLRHNLYVSGAAWCDFVSFDDRFPTDLHLFIVRLHAADAELDGYAKKAIAFLEEVDAEHKSLLGWKAAVA